MSSKKQFVCTKCNGLFKTRENLQKHLNRINPCDANYDCKKCKKTFDSASLLRRHESRKTPCVPTEVPIIKNNNLDNKCHLCGKSFATSSSLRRHQKQTKCPMADNQTAMMELLLKQTTMLMERLDKQQLSVQQITNNNNTVNVQNNLYVNVTICSFGKEDLNRLDTSEVMNLLKGQTKDFMPKMIEHVHANPNHPEFHNVFYDPEKEKAIVFAPISDTEMSWQTRDFKELSNAITKKIKEYIHPRAGPYFDQAMKAKDSETANKVIEITNTDWSSDEVLDKTRDSLSKVAKNKDFLKLVEVKE
jgi:Zinc finger, C2H2 type